MKAKTIALWMLIVTAIGVGWGIFHNQSVRAGSTNTAKDNIASPTAQAIDHGTVNQTTNLNFNFNFTGKPPDEPKPLKPKADIPCPDTAELPSRPQIIIAGPSVTFVNYTDNIQKGLVKAGFIIPIFNIGGIEAKDVTTRWTITDNGNNIMGLDKWLGLTNQPNYIVDLPPGTGTKFLYNPDIGASGIGMVELTLDYEYTNASTGEKYTGQYKGIVDYITKKDSQPRLRLITPQVL